MRAIGDAIADEALEWVGTPAVWLGRVKGVGCDCKGLIAGVALALGRPEGESIEALCADYRRGDSRRLLEGLQRLFDRATQVDRGDVLLLRVGGAPQHLAIVSAAQEGRAARIVHVHPGIFQVRDVPMGTMLRHSVHSIWRWRP